MAKTALTVLESALRERKLDRTLTTALPAVDRAAAAVAPSRIVALDACLHGGLPRGHLSELAGPAGSGRTTVLLHTLAAATRGGELAALVDACERLDVESAAAAGIALDRLLWVRPSTVRQAQGSRGAGYIEGLERMVDRALKALNLILQAGGFGVVALDLADVPARALKRLPMTTWLRLQRTIENSDTACLLVVPEPLARSAGGLTLLLHATTQWEGASDRSRRLTGLEVAVRIVSPRRRIDAECQVRCAPFDCDPEPVQGSARPEQGRRGRLGPTWREC
jgi:hypothetical protein